jgi:hypothetical protein
MKPKLFYSKKDQNKRVARKDVPMRMEDKARLVRNLVMIEEGEERPKGWQAYHAVIRALLNETCDVDGGIITLTWGVMKTRLVHYLCNPKPKKIPAIKMFRDLTGAGLKEAKDFIESLMAVPAKKWDAMMAKQCGITNPNFVFQEVAPEKAKPWEKGVVRPVAKTVQGKKKKRLRHRQGPKSRKKAKC